jgi:branched-chain amino acid transport system substrate-binding protein
MAAAALIGAPLPIRFAQAQAAALKVALLCPTTGWQAEIGQGAERAAAVANDVLAEMKVSVRLEVKTFDTQSSIDTARAQAGKAIGDGAEVLVGAFDSAHTLAIAEVCEQKGVPLIVNVASAPRITKSGFKFVVRNFPTAEMLIRGGFDIQKEIFKASGATPKKALLVTVNDMFGQAMVDAFKARFSELGMPYELAAAISYDPQTIDLAAEVAKAKASGADLLLPLCRAKGAGLMVQELVKQKWTPMGIITPASPGFYAQDFLKAAGKYGEYHISTLPWLDPKSAMTQSLARHHAAKYPNDQLDLDGGFTFEALLVAATARAGASSAKGDALMAALRNVKVDQHVMTGGPIQFDANGQNPNIRSAAVQNIKRKPTVVLPAADATGKLVFPEPGWEDSRRA